MTEDQVDRIDIVSSREEVPEGHREGFDAIKETRGSVGTTFGTLLNSPDMGGRVGHLGAYIRYEGILPGDERELAIITTAREFDSPYEWEAHEPIAREEGVSEAAIQAARRDQSVADLDEVESLVIRYTRQIINDYEVDDETYQEAFDYYGTQGITELTTTIGYYAMLACVHNVFELHQGPDHPWESD